MIKNKNTGQIYIGQSKNIEKRFKKHCSIPLVDIAIANEGKENFDFNIIEENVLDLYERETYWINYYNTYHDDFHYNNNDGNNIRFKRKYTLWDVSFIHYDKSAMFRKNFNLNPRKCFYFLYNNIRIPIGGFYDYVSIEIINQLTKEAIK